MSPFLCVSARAGMSTCLSWFYPGPAASVTSTWSSASTPSVSPRPQYRSPSSSRAVQRLAAPPSPNLQRPLLRWMLGSISKLIHSNVCRGRQTAHWRRNFLRGTVQRWFVGRWSSRTLLTCPVAAVSWHWLVRNCCVSRRSRSSCTSRHCRVRGRPHPFNATRLASR